MPDPFDPTTVTKTFKAGRKASAQANLASRSKTPNSKSRRRWNKGHKKNSDGRRMELKLSGGSVGENANHRVTWGKLFGDLTSSDDVSSSMSPW